MLDDLGTESATPWAREKLFQMRVERLDLALEQIHQLRHRVKVGSAGLRPRAQREYALLGKIKQFGGHARQGGGVCAVEMALWDLADDAGRLHYTYVHIHSLGFTYTDPPGGLDLFANQSSGVLTSTVWADMLVDNPSSKSVAKGDTVQARVINVDGDNQRLSLSVREFLPNEWDNFAKLHNVGDEMVGTISKITDFGLANMSKPGEGGPGGAGGPQRGATHPTSPPG